MSQREPCREIRITNVVYRAYNDIRNISKKKGISITKFVSHRLTEIIRVVPEHMKQAKCELSGELRVSGIGDRTNDEWQRLADYYGVDKAAVIKIKLIDSIDAMPAHEKAAMLE